MADWDVVSRAPLDPGWEVASNSGPPGAGESPDLSDRPLLAPGDNPIDSALHVGARGLQAFRESLYKTASMPANGLAALGRLAGLNTPSPEQGPTIFDKEPQTPAEKGAAYVGGAAGDVASTAVPFGFGAKLASKTVPSVLRGVSETMAAKPAAQVALNTTGNAAAPEIQSSDLPEFTKPYAQMAVPFALGGMTHMGQRMVSAAPAATTQEAERRALLDYGQSIGGKNTAGKIMDSKRMQTLESVNSQLPLPYVGGNVARTEAANRNAYQAEALRKAGDTSGATGITPNVTQEVKAKVGDKFNFLTDGLVMKIGPQFGADLAKARGSLSEQLESQIPKDIKTQLNELQSAADALKTEPLPKPPTPSADKYPSTDVGPYLGEQPKPNPQPNVVTLEGRTYQNIRSKLSGMLNGAHGNDKQAIGKMIDALDNVAERNMPKENFQDLKDARQQWRNMLALDKAMGGANNGETAIGNLPTAAYMRASRGNPDIEKLGRYGAAFVGDKIPNSHTAPRASFGHLGAGLGGTMLAGYEGMTHAPGPTMAAAGASTIPFLFGAAMNNPITRATMLARLRNPSNSLIGTPTFGALAGQQALNQGR